MKRIAFGIAAAAISIGILAAIGALFGHRDLLSILIGGSIGSPFALEGTLLKSIPLLLTGLAVVIAFRGGIIQAPVELC